MSIQHWVTIQQANGADWQRQLKTTSTPFDETTSNIVCIEALRQGKEKLEHQASQDSATRTMAKDTRTLSPHVLSNASCGRAYRFKNTAEPHKEGHAFNYRDSLALGLEHILLLLVVGPKLLTHRSIPKKWRRIGQATIDFKAYMTDMLNDEKRQMGLQKPGGGNLVTSLIRASDQQPRSRPRGSQPTPTISWRLNRG